MIQYRIDSKNHRETLKVSENQGMSQIPTFMRRLNVKKLT